MLLKGLVFRKVYKCFNNFNLKAGYTSSITALRDTLSHHSMRVLKQLQTLLYYRLNNLRRVKRMQDRTESLYARPDKDEL